MASIYLRHITIKIPVGFQHQNRMTRRKAKKLQGNSTREIASQVVDTPRFSPWDLKPGKSAIPNPGRQSRFTGRRYLIVFFTPSFSPLCCETRPCFLSSPLIPFFYSMQSNSRHQVNTAQFSTGSVWLTSRSESAPFQLSGPKPRRVQCLWASSHAKFAKNRSCLQLQGCYKLVQGPFRPSE